MHRSTHPLIPGIAIVDPERITGQATSEISVVITGQELMLPNIRKTIDDAGIFSEYNLVRSGTQFTLIAELPQNLKFKTVINDLAALLGGQVSGVTAGLRPYGVIRIEKPQSRSAMAGTLKRLRRQSGSKSRSPNPPAQPEQPQVPSPLMKTALPGVEGSSLLPVMQQSELEPEPGQLTDPRGTISIRIAIGRLARVIRFVFLAVLTALAIVLEPFTRIEPGKSDGNAPGKDQQKDRQDPVDDINE